LYFWTIGNFLSVLLIRLCFKIKFVVRVHERKMGESRVDSKAGQS
jgi:hypothetical protein